MVEDQLFHKALHTVDAVMRQVKTDDMNKPTPCSEWDVRALMNHIVSETAWVEPLLQGKTVDEVGSSLDGDMLGTDPHESWHAYMIRSMNAANLADPEATAHLSYGNKSVKAYLDEVGGDIIIHAWDLAKGVDTMFIIDEDTCSAVMRGTRDVMPLGRQGGLIADVVPVKDSAGPMEKLLALYGRDIHWSA